LQKKYGIRFKATATGWLYEWSAGGMLERVVNPQQGKVTFGYDALGRRVYKEVKHTRTHWLWDGNVPLHEWQTTEKEPLIDMVTWVFEEGTFVPAARVTDSGSQSILTDYLGTPVEMYGENGEKTWEAQLDIYGRVRTFVGSSLSDCPFRYQGQYQDEETGLYYNRFRYYDPSIGAYLSQDPIGLNGGMQIYGYVHDSNSWIDILGLAKHHTIPRRIYNPRTSTRVDGTRYRPVPILPDNVAKDSKVRGTRSTPNMWDIPDNVHADIHNPNSAISMKNGGDYNTEFIRRVNELGPNIMADDVVDIRDQMTKDYDIEQYRPKGGH
jgi:RHS repeat-associated protein